MKSTEEFKTLVYNKRNEYYEKRKKKRRFLVLTASTTLCCLLCFFIFVDNRMIDTSSKNDCLEKETLKTESIAESSNETTGRVEISVKMQDEVYNKVYQGMDVVNEITACINSLDNRYVREKDEKTTEKFSKAYVTVTVVNDDSLSKSHVISNEGAKKILEVLKKYE